MSKIAIVTDSTAYIPGDLVQKYHITIAPQILIWGDQTFRDGVDIQPDEFYIKLGNAKVMPTTSQVSVFTLTQIFQSLIDQDFEVLGIFISGKLSGTIQSAIQAREGLNATAGKVAIVDSYTTAMAMGFLALAAARAAEKGANLEACKTIVENGREHTGVYFAMDTLEFLHRGGRIGGAARFIGSALNLKPILALKDGVVVPEDRVRTKSKAVDRVFELVAEQVRGKSNIRLATLHANAEAEAQALLDRSSKELNAVESILSTVSPVVGTHAGPGTVGMAFIAGV